MALRSLLGLLAEDPRTEALAREGDARSCRRRFAPTRWRRSPIPTSAPRWWWWATIAPRATWQPIYARGWRRVPSATTPRAGLHTSPTSPPRPTSWACAWRRSMRSSTTKAGSLRSSSSPRWPSRRRCPILLCARTPSRSRWASCSTSRSALQTSWRRATSASIRWRSAASSRCGGVSSTSTPPRRSARCVWICSTK